MYFLTSLGSSLSFIPMQTTTASIYASGTLESHRHGRYAFPPILPGGNRRPQTKFLHSHVVFPDTNQPFSLDPQLPPEIKVEARAPKACQTSATETRRANRSRFRPRSKEPLS